MKETERIEQWNSTMLNGLQKDNIAKKPTYYRRNIYYQRGMRAAADQANQTNDVGCGDQEFAHIT